MFQFQGMWLPEGEAHFQHWMEKNGEIVDGRGTYQIAKWRACLPWIKNWRVAIDCGCHIGFWSFQMLPKFRWLHAFEPVEQYRDCWLTNCGTVFDNWDLYVYALGSKAGRISMVIPPLGGGIDSGGTHVGEGSDVEMRTLDSFGFENVDFVKIDCEGYEHRVIEGARETLLRCKPCVIVEQKPQKLGENFGIKGTPAVDLLREMGAIERACLSGDHILSWD